MLRILPKDEFVLTRYHPHLVRPFKNECKISSSNNVVITRKSFSNRFVTVMMLISSFFVGYCYARLSRDEYARRRAYARYSNFMTLFDGFSRSYEKLWSAIIDFVVNFDHSEQFWRLRQRKWAEFSEARRMQPEIYQKQA